MNKKTCVFISNDSVEAIGYYGEMARIDGDDRGLYNIDSASKQKITYKLEDGTWKIDNFEIKTYN